VWPARIADSSIVLVVSYVKLRMEAQHSYPSLSLKDFISVFNQLDAQNLFHNKFHFVPLHVLSTCAQNM